MKEKLRQKALELGFGKISVMPVQSLSLWDEGIEIRKVLDPDTAEYWESRGLVSDCTAVLENAKTIIAAVFPYKPYRQAFSQGQGCYSAHYEAYPRGKNAISDLGKLLTDEGYDIAVDPPVPDKLIAYLSGLGRFGKNGLIHNGEFGSFMTLHTILTNAELPPDDIEPGEISDCGRCRLCIDACPMQAIADNGVILVSRCLRYHMLSSDIIPIEIREKIGNRILGCEDCQIICPRNREAYKQTVNVESKHEVFGIGKLLSDYKTGLKKHMAAIGEVVGRNYARPQRILSMAVIASGNSGDRTYVPLLSETLHHPDPAIRAHSAWAVGKLGGKLAGELLQNALEQEQDLNVRQDISLALRRIEEAVNDS